MPLLHLLYHPITASPFQKNDTYCELAPCEALKPYIRCFWGTPMPLSGQKKSVPEAGLVIPDTCMDIIFHINYTKNCWNGCFCTMDETAHPASNETCTDITSTFGIRFYAWSAILFTENPLNGSKNEAFDVRDFFNRLSMELEPFFFDFVSLTEL